MNEVYSERREIKSESERDMKVKLTRDWARSPLLPSFSLFFFLLPSLPFRAAL